MMRVTTIQWTMLLALTGLLGSGLTQHTLCADDAKPVNTPQTRKEPEAPFVNVADLPAPQGEFAQLAFVPQPGRFELKVPAGWTGFLPVGGSHDLPWLLTASNQIGVKRDAQSGSPELAEMFSSDHPILEISGSTVPLLIVRACRPGIATIHYASASDTDAKPARCELRIVVEPDTTEFDRAIREATPRAKVRVVAVRQGCLLLGTISHADEAALIKEIAQMFYPSVIARLEVAAHDGPHPPKPVVPPQPTASPSTSGLPAAQPIPPAGFTRPPVPAARRLPADLPPPRVSPTAPRPARDLSDLKALRDEVRALREDVRRLNEMIERSAVASERQVPGKSLPDTHASKHETDVTDGLLCFTASWCDPCQKMRPIVARLIDDGQPVVIVDIDQSPRMAKRFHVTSIPCFIRMAGGKEIDRATGVIAEAQLRNLGNEPSDKQPVRPLTASLEKQVALELTRTPLTEAVLLIGQQTGMNVVLDQRGLDEEGLSKDQPVSMVVKNISARSALRLILEPLNLAVVERDEVLLVTSRQRTEGELVVKTYPVLEEISLDDLCELIQSTITPDSWDVMGGRGSIRSFGQARQLVVRQTTAAHQQITELLMNLPRRSPAGLKEVTQELIIKAYTVADLVVPLPGEPEDRKTPRATDWLKLIDSITTTVEPKQWLSNGGACHVEPQESTMSLVIRATPAMHEAIAGQLSELRRKQDVQLVLETRLMQTKDDSVLKQEDLKIELDPRTQSAQLQEHAASRLVEAVASAGGSTLSAPKITLFNGQMGYIQTSIEGKGGESKELKLYLRGATSSDHRGVRLNVALNPESLVRELVRQSHTLDDGGHLLIDMTDTFPRDMSSSPTGRVLLLVRTKRLVQGEEVQDAPAAVQPAGYEKSGE